MANTNIASGIWLKHTNGWRISSRPSARMRRSRPAKRATKHSLKIDWVSAQSFIFIVAGRKSDQSAHALCTSMGAHLLPKSSVEAKSSPSIAGNWNFSQKFSNTSWKVSFWGSSSMYSLPPCL